MRSAVRRCPQRGPVPGRWPQQDRQVGSLHRCTDAPIRRSASRACAGLATHRARDLVGRGEYFLRQPLSAASLHAARARFDDALRESPHSASACVGLARAWLNLATGWYHDPALAGEHAAEALQQALAIDPMLPMAHALMGVLQNQWQRDWPAAQRSFRRAVALAPDAAFVRAAWGSHLFMRGRLEEAEAELQIARQLDPLYVNARAHMINLRCVQDRLAEAQAEWAGLADLAPDSLSVHGLGAVLAVRRGDVPAAIRHYRRACELLPDHPGCWAHLAGALALDGQLAEARRTLDDLQQRFAGRPMSPYVLAIVALRMGEPAQALAWLGRAVDEGDPSVLLTPMDSCLAPLRGDPAFERLCLALRHKRGAPAVRPAAPATGAAAKPAAPRRPPGPAAASPARARRPARRS